MGLGYDSTDRWPWDRPRDAGRIDQHTDPERETWTGSGQYFGVCYVCDGFHMVRRAECRGRIQPVCDECLGADITRENARG